MVAIYIEYPYPSGEDTRTSTVFIVAASLSTVALFTVCVVTAVATSALLIKIRQFSKSKRNRKGIFLSVIIAADNDIIKCF